MSSYCDSVLHYLYEMGYSFAYSRIGANDVTFTDADSGISATYDINFCIETGIDPYNLAYEIVMTFDLNPYD